MRAAEHEGRDAACCCVGRVHTLPRAPSPAAAWDEWKAENKEHHGRLGAKKAPSGLTQEQLIELQHKLFEEARAATLSGPLPSSVVADAVAQAAAAHGVPQQQQQQQVEPQQQAEQQQEEQEHQAEQQAEEAREQPAQEAPPAEQLPEEQPAADAPAAAPAAAGEAATAEEEEEEALSADEYSGSSQLV